MTWRVCVECGEPSPASRCDAHQPKSAPKSASSKARGYDSTWKRLSERARRLQPFCVDCNTTENLTVDHLPIAWQRKAEGKPIRLVDVAVRCGPCNVAQGSARPGSARAKAAEKSAGESEATGDDPRRGQDDPVGKAKSGSHFGTQAGGTA